MYSTRNVLHRAEPFTGKQRSVVSDSPDQQTGPALPVGQDQPVGRTEPDPPVKTAGRAGPPCRYSTEEEHLVAFLENGREE
jgi:hypothetical protein